MRRLYTTDSHLLMIDFQARLMPAIHDGMAAVARARTLLAGARLLRVRRSFTEQVPDKLGQTIPDLAPGPGEAVLPKSRFDAGSEVGLATRLPRERGIVVAGCEAHVCVLQTVLGLLEERREVAVVIDATGSRRPEDRAAALARMERAGAMLVTTEMVLFEWMGGSNHPRFREVSALIR
jgi:nicotinamidase-related amidase